MVGTAATGGPITISMPVNLTIHAPAGSAADIAAAVEPVLDQFATILSNQIQAGSRGRA